MTKARRIKGIDCNAPAGDGMRLALVTRFEEMSKLREAALSWKDPEGVHSMRVASRRLRSALHDFMPYLRKRQLTSSLPDIKRVADALGQVRDQDVAIAALENMNSDAPPQVLALLHHLIHVRKQIRSTARQKLRRGLSKKDLRQLGSAFAAAVETATAGRERNGRTTAGSNPTYLDIARSIILDRLAELEKLSNSLYRPLQPEPLHQMRIAAKRLRYAIELFQQCWGQAMDPIANNVASLQQTLGELHDCDVWIESFGNHIVDSKKKKEPDQSEEFAWLLSQIIKVRSQHLSDSFARWRQWEVNGLSESLRAMLN